LNNTLVFFLIVAVVVLLVVVIVLLSRRQKAQGGGGVDSGGSSSSQAPSINKSIDDVEPGDGIAFWGGDNVLARTVLECSEEANNRTSNWRWIILGNDQLLWIAPDGKYIYEPPQIIYQGSPEFEQITGDPGVLRAFEQRVREGVSGSQPVNFAYGDINYTVRSTGTFAAEAKGDAASNQVWADVSPDGSQNVYFELEGESGERALGIWTSHIAWYTGRVLNETDIDSVYAR
jgi:hypothetical protein